MSRLIERHAAYLAALVIVLAGLFVLLHLPHSDDFRSGADEGTYYGYGKRILERGGAGFAELAREFEATPASAHPPNPLRLGTVLAATAALAINDSYTSLALLSLASFVLLLWSTWWFVARYWNRTLALTTVVLLAVSPLQLGLARRALMDSLALSMAALSFFLLVRLLDGATPRRIAAFVVAFAAAILVKETALFLLPLYALVLGLPLQREAWRTRRWPWRAGVGVLAALALPPLLAGLAYLAAYGLDHVLAILRLLPQRSDYDALWEQGPWYRYLIDYLTLSPYVTLLALAYLGYALAAVRDRYTWWLVALGAWLLLAYAATPKNLRYCALLDLPLRVLAAAMLLVLLGRARVWLVSCGGAGITSRVSGGLRAVLPALLLLALMTADLAAFRRYFVIAGIYDPVSYNLFEAAQIVPKLQLPQDLPVAVPADAVLAAARARALAAPDAASLLALGGAYCSAGLALECSWASQQAIRLAPDDARAFNMLCVAYNDLHDWPRAIAACNEAVRLAPDFTLARNNLAWAQTHAATAP